MTNNEFVIDVSQDLMRALSSKGSCGGRDAAADLWTMTTARAAVRFEPSAAIATISCLSLMIVSHLLL